MKKIKLISLSILEVLELHAATMSELRRRKVTKSSNGPLADYAEHIVCKALKLRPAVNSTKGYDATDVRDAKYEIKARRQTALSKPSRFSALRDLEHHHFDYLVAVLFAEDFKVKRAVVLPRTAIKRLAFRQEHVNAWILPLQDSLWTQTGAKDITARLASIQKQGEQIL